MQPGDAGQISAELRRAGFAVIEKALRPQEVAALNTWIDTSQAQHPATWYIPETRSGIYEYWNPLLDGDSAQLDRYLRLPATADALDELLGGQAALNQFDFRETPEGECRHLSL
jgi:hypothetical protein